MPTRRVTRHSRSNVVLAIKILILVAAGHFIAGCAPADPPKAAARSKSAEPAAEEIPAEAPHAKTVATAGPSLAAKALYDRHCAACHGERGDGQGLAARFLFPKPRNFRNGHFRLVSTSNGAPTTEDIVSVLKRGMPGSSMPPWPNLKDDELRLLADYVVELRRTAIRDQERALAAEGGYEATPEDIEKTVVQLTTPGPRIEVPEIGSGDAASIERGKVLYLKSCASCHGLEGKGDGQQSMVDAEGVPARPRDLTRGIFKGNPDPASIYRRTLAGMPGSPMPATRQATPEEISDLVHYLLSLSDEQTRQATVLNRESLMAHYSADVPESPAAAAWKDVSPVRLRMTPLWWRNDFEPNLDVQAVHDGRTIAFRLSWKDVVANTTDARTEAFEDAVAIELYRGNDEPFLGMGAANAAIDAWFWDADRQTGFAAVEDVYPRTTVDVYPLTETVAESSEYKRAATRLAAQAPVTLPAQSVGNQISPDANVPVATSLEAVGPGSVTFRPRVSQLVRAQGEWKEGRWTVVMTRELSPRDAAAGLALAPGQRASVAFAVWEGSHRDRNGQKLITIWQDLELEQTGR